MSQGMFWVVLLWGLFMLAFLGIGGYFMFRKFLKSLPREDGKSILEWQEYYIEQTRHLWTEEQKELLEELVRPVPKLFRDAARQKIAAKIGELALKEQATEMSEIETLAIGSSSTMVISNGLATTGSHMAWMGMKW